ncbi:tyrosine-type recombinase/integrase [Pseudoalteromonas ruthenica]|uniref:Integrase n=1 Tax=Pseudoalteromonas ruthenica TaxID=151081 RepID=A0A0F4PNQ3_9GAMM|nr:site-specific integrase [Pseudoalteromonas ruthenica]KJY96663.1 integrase [Pseudoalteromonas ruthenica]KJY98534.1 integrase [Pseudoalteromonas ruthenica]TMO91256.1 site-specific integrase [Pseudoalteromonas ruthenica]TMO97943.1 site-specific integrase [Pseudoalteromonas ruthenica]TMP06836.1 site-specific integrase [Pseudoalteromonas ruthenica]
MAKLIYSGDVFSETTIPENEDDNLGLQSYNDNLGSLPTIYDAQGNFVHVVNSYFFDLKAASRLKDISSNSRGLLKYWSFLESQNLSWNSFPPLKHLKPTYMFRSFLLVEIKQNVLSQSTANAYINHVRNFYTWAISEGFLDIRNEKEAPFKIEKISIQNSGSLAHLQPTIIVYSSDLRIRVAKSSQSIRSLSPLSRNDLSLLTKCMMCMSVEFQLQCLLAMLSGLRIQEVSTFTIEALKTSRSVTEGSNRHEVIIGPSTGVQTKYGKQRTIEIPDHLLQCLKRYSISERRLSRAHKLKGKLLAIHEGGVQLNKDKAERFVLSERFEPLFISEQGNPVDKASINARWSDLRKKAKLINSSFSHKFHDLRSTYGTFRLNDMLEVNIKPIEALELLMGWMGHNHETTTWKYLKYLKRKEAQKEKFALLDTIMHEAIRSLNE